MTTDFDLFTNYLVIFFVKTTSTGLSSILDNSIGHQFGVS